MENVLVGWGVEIYNNHMEDLEISSYNIDMRYYLSKINKILLQLRGKDQLKLELF